MKHNMHENSLAAYEQEHGHLSARAFAILELLRMRDVPLTDRQIMRELGFFEPNAVRPRITELILARLLVETGKVQCGVTNKMVRLVGIAGSQRKFDKDGQPVLF